MVRFRFSSFLLTALAACMVFNFERSLCAQDVFEGSREEAMSTFLDNNAPKERRLSAAAKLAFPKRRESAKLVEFATDKEVDDELRQAVIAIHGSRTGALGLAQQILSDPGNGSENLKLYCVDYLSGFRLNDKSEIWKDVQSTLRKTLDDERETVRSEAYEILVARNDNEAVAKLVNGLKEEKPVLSTVRSLELLNQSNPVQHLSAIRPYLKNSDSKVVSEAVKALSLDLESRDEIVQLLRNSNTEKNVRFSAVQGLGKWDPGFAGYAETILGNPNEDLDIKSETMKVLGTQLRKKSTISAQEQSQLEKIIKTIEQDENSPDSIKSGASRLDSMMKKKMGSIGSPGTSFNLQGAQQTLLDANLAPDVRKKLIQTVSQQADLPLEGLVKVIKNRNDDTTVRKEAVVAVMRALNKGKSVDTSSLEALAEELRSMSKNEANEDLKSYSNRVVPWIEKRFPNLKK